MSEQEEFDSDKDNYDIFELLKLGREYRKEMELTVFGKPTSVTIRPLIDKESIPHTVRLQKKFGVEERGEAIDEAEEYVEEAREEGGINMSEVDEEFMEIMEDVYEDGICPELTWPDEEPDEAVKRADFLRDESMDGAVIEIAMEILDLSGTLDDALQFPGSRAK